MSNRQIQRRQLHTAPKTALICNLLSCVGYQLGHELFTHAHVQTCSTNHIQHWSKSTIQIYPPREPNPPFTSTGHAKSKKKQRGATLKPIAGPGAAALLSTSSPMNASMMTGMISSLFSPPPCWCATDSCWNRAMSTNDGFKLLLFFNTKFFNSKNNHLLRSCADCCLKSARSCAT